MKIRIAGIDPSMNNFGVALGYMSLVNFAVEIDTLEVIRASKLEASVKKKVRVNSDDLRRAREIFAAANDLLKEPTLIFAELPVGSQSSRAQTSYGVCLGLLASINKPLIELTPNEVKLAAAGKNASKASMIEWAMKEHPEAPWKMRKLKGEMVSVDGENEHLADAVAAIHAGIKTQQFKQIIDMMAQMRMSVGAA